MNFFSSNFTHASFAENMYGKYTVDINKDVRYSWRIYPVKKVMLTGHEQLMLM